MMAQNGEVLYVGKARNLKKRVSSYFKSSTISEKTRALIGQIADIRVTVTHSEVEALILESNLIKRLKPKYNILLRDDKTYPYVTLSQSHQFPKIDMVRTKSKPKKGEYFGPYPSVTAVKETLLLLQKLFKLRTCRDSQFNSRKRPCLQYQIKRCSAPCVGYIDEKAYRQEVDDATAFLTGRSQVLIKRLTVEMDSACQQLDYEAAARLRDQIKNLRKVQESQCINQGEEDVDVIAIQADFSVACIQLLSIREGQVIASQQFFPSLPRVWLDKELISEASLKNQVFNAFVSQYYFQYPERVPPHIIASLNLLDKDSLIKALTELTHKKCLIQTVVRGVRAKWLDLAKKNLILSVANLVRSKTKILERYSSLQQVLNLKSLPTRMECFDVSHTLGEATVASCVVFNEDGPMSHDYRRFNIEGITPGDDYAAMKQALTRRYKSLKQTKQKLPDILFIDGGKGQVRQAQEVFESLGITDIILIGVAKGPERKAGWETLIIASDDTSMSLPIDSPALHLIQHIRDEAHRFAITAHRNRRHKARFESSLESIDGIGPKRRQALLKRFGGLQELAKASSEEIAKVAGISRMMAKTIYQHFNG